MVVDEIKAGGFGVKIATTIGAGVEVEVGIFETDSLIKEAGRKEAGRT